MFPLKLSNSDSIAIRISIPVSFPDAICKYITDCYSNWNPVSKRVCVGHPDSQSYPVSNAESEYFRNSNPLSKSEFFTDCYANAVPVPLAIADAVPVEFGIWQRFPIAHV